MTEEKANCELRIASDIELSPTDILALPTETEIYILPDGEIVVADLPVELSELMAQFRQIQ